VRDGRGGVDPERLEDFLDALDGIPLDIQGLMAVAPLSSVPGSYAGNSEEKDIDREFSRLEEFFTLARANHPYLRYLSAGMSGDYQHALLHGATHIRIGSQILGSRDPHH
jgi:PLP dependent protein